MINEFCEGIGILYQVHFSFVLIGNISICTCSVYSFMEYHFSSLNFLLILSNSFHFVVFQADVCHAYQLLRKGGLKDENIIVFMYDDIAFNEENPRPGVIINNPHGNDVYKGVPKVYF